MTPTEEWDTQISTLCQALADIASSHLGHTLHIGHEQPVSVPEDRTEGLEPETGLQFGIAVAGGMTGTVVLLLDTHASVSLAAAAFDQPPPDHDDLPQLDEARAQAVEDLVSALAAEAGETVQSATGSALEMAISDRDFLLSAQDSAQALATPGIAIPVRLELDEQAAGSALICLPQELFAELDDEEDLDDFEPDESQHAQEPEDDDQGLGLLKPEEMAALTRDSDDDGSWEEESSSDPDGTEEDSASEAEPEEASGQEEPHEEAATAQESPPEEVEEAVDIRAVHTTLLQASYNISEELQAFFGQPLDLADYRAQIVTKKDFFHLFEDKQVITNLAVSGHHYGGAFAVVSLADAIFLATTLIMLPAEEIERKIRNGHFREEESDAFGEVVNILAGAYSNAFGEYFPHNLRLKKDRMSTVAPTKVSIQSDEPFPDGEYFLASYSMHLGSRALRGFYLLFPPEMLGLSHKDYAELKKHPVTEDGTPASGSGFATFHIQGDANTQPAIALITDDPQQASAFQASLEVHEEVEICQIRLRDNLRERLRPYNVVGAFLVLKKIDDNCLATLIKVRSILKGRCPLIIAGPKWTRTMVLRAVSYGAKDILVTPADPVYIEEKVNRHMLKN